MTCWCAASMRPLKPCGPAEYYWLTQPAGHWVALCARCCIQFREIATREPDLQAARITSVRPRGVQVHYGRAA